MSKIAIIGAIEGTSNRRLEKDYLLLVESLRRNAGVYKDVDIHLVQPTQFDITHDIYNRLQEIPGIYYHKIETEYNQTSREFNYTNKPIACEWLYDNIGNDYDYFLWIDGDVVILQELVIPEIKNDEIVYLYNNQFLHNETTPGYITHNSTDFLTDKKLYYDLMSKAGELEADLYTATNSWIIYASTKSPFWKEWNTKTREYINFIQKEGANNFAFYNKSKNFENRVEELTMDIVIKSSNLSQVLPERVHTFNNKDTEHIDDYVEQYNTMACMVHYDDITCVPEQSSNLNRYFTPVWLKAMIYKIYGADMYDTIYNK
tara:strand:+ start:8077 stop:9027 length:951 start_codon:yes stop_codon:yes gene_type:complete